MPASTAQIETDRRLPIGDEIFLDHVGHFVSDAAAAGRALVRAGFAPTPISIQVNPDAAGGARPTGTGNITAMLAHGYLEVLFKTSDTALSRELDDALAKHAGVHLAAFAVADAAKAHSRLAASGFPVRELVSMQRPAQTATGTDIAAFTVARVEPGVMPEGRIQILTHHTEDVVWQTRWLKHPNSAVGLIDVVIAVDDIAGTTERFSRFTGRPSTPTRTAPGAPRPRRRASGQARSLGRSAAGGGHHHGAVHRRLCRIVESLAAAEVAVEKADLDWRAFEGGIITGFPPELGEGVWFFAEQAAALPWRADQRNFRLPLWPQPGSQHRLRFWPRA